MELSFEEKEKIKNSYIGDLTWLDTILEIVKGKNDNDEILKLITTLYKMNYVIMETETEVYAEKYYDISHNLYSQMKADLMEKLNYSNMWEEI